MKEYTAYKGRKLPDLLSFKSIKCTLSGISSLTKLVLSISVPVIATFNCGCKEKMDILQPLQGEIIHTDIKIEVKSTDHSLSSATILTFNADSLGRLDSYQYVDDLENGEVCISSTSGRKKSYIFGNLKLNKEDIARIATVYDLKKHSCNLEDITSSTPFMIGTTEIVTGAGAHGTVVMKPMISEIVLNSINCIFSGTSYEGEKITDARIYLTNVNAQCSLADSSGIIQRLVNVGSLNPEDIRQFSDPSIIARSFHDDIGEEKIHPDIRLYCFHNFHPEEGPGSPFTRLVLEGKIQGETYYWPILINRGDAGDGIRNNSRYVFDLTIRRKGSRDPDTEISIKDLNLTMAWSEWEEKSDYIINF